MFFSIKGLIESCFYAYTHIFFYLNNAILGLYLLNVVKNMLKRGCFAHLKEKMIMKCWLDQYLENILLEDLRHAKGYPLWCGWPLFNQWGQGSKVELVLYCDSHILREFVVQTSNLKDGYFVRNWRDTLCFWLK